MNIENQFTGGSEGYVESEEKIILIPDDRKVIIKNVVCRSEILLLPGEWFKYRGSD